MGSLRKLNKVHGTKNLSLRSERRFSKHKKGFKEDTASQQLSKRRPNSPESQEDLSGVRMKDHMKTLS